LRDLRAVLPEAVWVNWLVFLAVAFSLAVPFVGFDPDFVLLSRSRQACPVGVEVFSGLFFMECTRSIPNHQKVTAGMKCCFCAVFQPFWQPSPAIWRHIAGKAHKPPGQLPDKQESDRNNFTEKTSLIEMECANFLKVVDLW